MRAWPKVGDRVHLRTWENVVAEKRGQPWPEWEVVDVDCVFEKLPIALRHPETAEVAWYARREIIGVVD